MSQLTLSLMMIRANVRLADDKVMCVTLVRVTRDNLHFGFNEKGNRKNDENMSFDRGHLTLDADH